MQETISKLTMMINSIQQHIVILKQLGISTKQADNYLISLEMLLEYYNNIQEDLCHS